MLHSRKHEAGFVIGPVGAVGINAKDAVNGVVERESGTTRNRTGNQERMGRGC